MEPPCPYVGPTRGLPYLDLKNQQSSWRMVNFVLSLVFAYLGYSQLQDPGWWLWLPGYILAGVMCSSIAFDPEIVSQHFWRYICASIIVLGSCDLVYTYWVIRDISSFGYLQNPSDIIEGRQCGFMAFIIVWAVICRMTAPNIGGLLLYLRLIIFIVVALCCIAVIGWSFCFYDSPRNILPYCKGLFVTGDNE